MNDSSAPSTRSFYNSPVFWGVILSTVLLLFVGWLAFQIGEEGSYNWQGFISSSPNEIGDTLAGLFASLAFIWIVVTVFLQSFELKEQRLVLNAQREEFAVMAEAQRAQVVAMQNQAKVFEDERLQRSQDRAKEHLDELIASVRVALVQCGLTWVFDLDGPRPFRLELYPFSPGGHMNADDISFFTSYLSAFDSNFPKLLRNTQRKYRAPEKERLEVVQDLVDRILSIKGGLSVAQLERLKRLKIEEIGEEIDLYLGAEIWN